MSDFVHGEQADVRKSHDVKHPHDLESGSDTKEMGGHSGFVTDVDDGAVEPVKAKELRQRGVLAKLRHGEEWLDEKMGVETQGIDRIKEEDKKPPSILNVFFLWFSVTCHVGTLPIGLLGPIYGLSFYNSVIGIVVGTVLGAMCTGFTGTLGPKLGLRQIACSRYSFGYYGAKLCSVLNVVVGGGFMVVNTVVVGQILASVSDYKMTIAVGCVIIGIVGYVVSLFGFKVIHTYEKYSWIVAFILLCVLVGQVGPKVDTSIPNAGTGLDFSGSMLSFIALNFSSASGWCSIAADYYCNYPADTNRWKIGALTFFGICIPTIFTTVIGACLGNVAMGNSIDGTAAVPALHDAYHDHYLGGLLLESFHPTGFAKFALVMFTFSVLGNNVAVNYSSGLSIQLLGHYFHAVPRFIWSLLNAIVIAVLAIAGQTHLSDIVSDFVSLLGYWTVSFTFILLIEDQFFRRREGYNLLSWDNPKALPWGAAAIAALLVGYCAGGVTGMQQVWYTGPIAAKIGFYGGDVGIYLSLVFTVIVYPIARTVEKKYTGR